jgi:hypothetical protein
MEVGFHISRSVAMLIVDALSLSHRHPLTAFKYPTVQCLTLLTFGHHVVQPQLERAHHVYQHEKGGCWLLAALLQQQQFDAERNV